MPQNTIDSTHAIANRTLNLIVMAASERRRSALIVTALSVEYQAVRSFLTDLTEHIHPEGSVYETGRFDVGHDIFWEVSLVEAGAGNVGAALETERAVAHLKPSVAFFVGVAGGIKDVQLCDVVVATKVYGYESGKQNELFESRPNVGESSYSLVQRARVEARKGNWVTRLKLTIPGKPRALLGPIAAGEKVISSTESELMKFLRHNYGDALAVEMEGRGFLQATHANQAVSALIVRGISDLIDFKAHYDRSGYQEFASHCASAFLFEVLANLEGSVVSSRMGRYVLVLSGSINEVDRSRAEAIVSHLRLLSEDVHLTLERIEGGSVRLVLRGSFEGYERLSSELTSGMLFKWIGIPVIALTDFEDLQSDHLHEEALLEQALRDARQGSAKARESFFTAIYVKLLDRLRAIVQRSLPEASWVDVEDIVQVAVQKVWVRFDSFHGDTAQEFVAWAISTARFTALDHMRKSMTFRRASRPEEAERPLTDELLEATASPLELVKAVENIEFIDAFKAAIAELSAQEREVVMMSFMAGLTSREIASTLGVSESSVRVVRHRALVRLRRILEEFRPEGRSSEPKRQIEY